MRLESLIAAVKSYNPAADEVVVTKAYQYAKEKHAGQYRSSGEPYFGHVYEVARLACTLHLDTVSICAALLHDTIEDCDVTHEDLAAQFGDEVVSIVEGVTKLTSAEYGCKEERQAESLRKMLLATARDIRVILIKLCDRLHNMRTLKHVSEERRYGTSRETQEIFAPIASRLGLHLLKNELEDLCLLNLRPEIYRLLAAKLEKEKGHFAGYISKTGEQMRAAVSVVFPQVEISGRFNTVVSLWRRMQEQNLSIDENNDLFKFLILLPSIGDCYGALGILHSAWRPVPNRFRDFIALPKSNSYQSLHTTIIGPQGMRLDVQVRTQAMHRLAEEGVVARWKYDGAVFDPRKHAVDLSWIKDLAVQQQQLVNPDAFFQSVRDELLPQEVVVFTPRGDSVTLPQDSTPIDFAYAIHSAIGDHFASARCNGVVVPLEHRLKNGDLVEVVTAPSQHPTKEWLDIVQTVRAKQRIHAFLKTQQRARAFMSGFEVLRRDLGKFGINLEQLEHEGRVKAVAESLGLTNEQALYAQIGYGKLTLARVLQLILPQKDESGASADESTLPTPLRKIFSKAATDSRQRLGVSVEGFDDVPLRLAQCCSPLPGDRIVGIISPGRGITVHLADCNQVLKSDPLRRIDVEWTQEVGVQGRVWVSVQAQDAPGLLASISSVISSNGASIASAQITTTELGKVEDRFELILNNARQLKKVMRELEMIPGMNSVMRLRGIGPSRPPSAKRAAVDGEDDSEAGGE